MVPEGYGGPSEAFRGHQSTHLLYHVALAIIGRVYDGPRRGRMCHPWLTQPSVSVMVSNVEIVSVASWARAACIDDHRYGCIRVDARTHLRTVATMSRTPTALNPNPATLVALWSHSNRPQLHSGRTHRVQVELADGDPHAPGAQVP